LDWKFQELQSENQSSQGNAQHRKEMLLLHKKLGRFAWMAWWISRLGRAALLLLRTHQRERGTDGDKLSTMHTTLIKMK